MTEFLLVCATPLEAKAILSAFPEAQALSDALASRPAGTTAPLTLAGRRCRLLLTGVGPLAAGIAAGAALGELRAAGDSPAGLLNLGIAGSFAVSGLALGDVVAAQAEVCPEFGLLTPGGLVPDGLKFGQGRINGTEIHDRIRLDPSGAAAAMGLRLGSWPQRDFLSVGMVSGWPERADEMAARYGCAVENMEGFALALAAGGGGLPLLEIRTVSNLVGSRPPEGWDIGLALRGLSEVLRELLSA